MTRLEFTENFRAVGVEMRRSPVEAAFAGIMALNKNDLLLSQERLAAMSSKTSGSKVTLHIEERVI